MCTSLAGEEAQTLAGASGDAADPLRGLLI